MGEKIAGWTQPLSRQPGLRPRPRALAFANGATRRDL